VESYPVQLSGPAGASDCSPGFQQGPVEGRRPVTAPLVRKRGAQAGIKGLHPHMFRHTFAYEWRMAGGDDDSLMRLVGWRSRQMLHRYGASAADARAGEAHQRLMPGDRF
jgi:integrase